MSSVDDFARTCKQNLQFSLSLTDTFTKDSKSPWEHLLNRMGAVLGTVVETNFGSSSHSRITDLYSTIAELTPSLTDSSSSSSFLHFARAFAVVMEESLRQLKKSRSEDTAVTCTTTHNQSSAAVSMPRQQAVQQLQQLQHSPSRLSHERAATATATPRINAKPMNKAEPIKNFLEEVRKGAVVVNQVLPTVSKSQMIQFLQKIGALAELSFPIYNMHGRTSPFAFAKYEDDESATRAVLKLNGTELNGRLVSVYRPSYWIEDSRHRVFLNKKPEQPQPVQPVQQLQQLQQHEPLDSDDDVD